MNKRLDRLTLVAFIFLVFIIGINFVAVRIGNQELPPFWGAGSRFGIASLFFFLIAYIKGLTLPKGRALLGATIYGILTFGVSYGFTYFAQVKVQASFASVAMSLVPLLTFFLAVVQGLESFRWRALTGGLLAIVGIFLIFRDQLNLAVPLLPLLAMVIASLSAAETNIVVKGFAKSHPISTNAIAMAVGSALLLTISFIIGEPKVIPSLLSTWIAFIYLVFIGSIILFALYIFIITRWSASTTSYQFVLSPLVTVAVASLLVNEKVSPFFILGAFLVIVGVYISALSSNTPSG